MKETKTMEFKSEISNSFLKTVSAYANFGSGDILFGVDDTGATIGMPDPRQACLDIENKINDTITPKPEFSLSIHRGTGVVTLSVKQGEMTPYLYKGKAYRRGDTATVKADPLELRRLILQGEHLSFEQLACGCENLSFSTLKEMLCQKLAVSNVTEDVLLTLGFYTKNRQFNNAAALLADENPFYGVDVARFGKNINEIMERETIAHVSILEQYTSCVRMFQKNYQYEKIEGMERRKISLIPEAAFREALANALVHRMWDVDAHIRVAMFPDRIEITSPGGLPSFLSEKEYLNGFISNLRNPIIGNVFFRLGIIEMFGTGIRRIRDCYASMDSSPTFVVSDNSITVRLPLTQAAPMLTTDEKLVLDTLSGGLILSSGEIVAQTGLNRAKVIRLLKILSEKRMIQIHGRGRGTRYSRKS